MDKRILITVACSALASINASASALAETVGRLECSVVGAASQDPIGDKDEHRLTTVQYSCLGVDGVLKDALYSGTATSEWKGSQATYLTGGGIIRVPGGLAVTLLTEGVGSAITKDGKPAGSEASGKGLFKFASGTLAAFSGKAESWHVKPAGFNRFSLELSSDENIGAMRTSKE
jgi:hypothetical protein